MLKEAFDIPDWLERDEKLSWRERVQRDKNLAQATENSNIDEISRLLLWWNALDKGDQQLGPGKEISFLLRRVSLILIVLGALCGLGLAGALMHYDGSQPINILMLLAWLVFLPLVFLFTSLLLPYIQSDSFLGGINPGSIVLSLFKKKSLVLEEIFSTNRAHVNKDKFMRWRLMLYSQIFGLALALTALVTILIRVSFSDLAFGWSTTLALDANSLAQWLQALAWPWASWFPEAVPSLELIQQSRYFRLEGVSHEISAEALTHWWKFIVMCLLFYAVLLRLILLLFTNFKYRQAIKSMLLQHPEITALFDRMNEVIETVQSDAPQVVATHGSKDSEIDSIVASSGLVVLWNGAVMDHVQHENVIRAGGENSLQQDAENLRNVNLAEGERICVVTKSWEPPLLEFHDYIKSLRAHFGAEVSILVQPINADGDKVNTTNVEVWRQSIIKLQDPKVYVP